MQAFEEFLAYKNRIPVRGAIMLNEAMDSTVLVKGWKKGANWSFPRGKINKDEDDLICAIREVYEETGLDLETAGLIPHDRNVKYIEINIRDQQMRLYVFKNVPLSTHFEPRTRKEISKIEWWRLSDLPSFKKKNQHQEADPALNANKFYMVAPFLAPLRKWINQQKQSGSHNPPYPTTYVDQEAFLTEDDRDDLEPQAPYEVSAPESNSVDDAGEMLSRLLNVQPARSVPPQQQLDSSSGSALLALLQSKPADTTTAQQPPQTPLEQLVGAAPVPVTPQHHHPQAHATQLPPPPLFPIHPVNNHVFHHEIPNYVAQQPLIPVYPLQQPTQQPGYQPTSHHNQPQHLIHPQPLPPNVQKAVFTGGVVPSPPIPQSASNVQASWQGQPINNASYVAAKNAVPPVHLIPDSRRQPLPQLNNHSMSLLNAFKNAGPLPGSAPNHVSQPLRSGSAHPRAPPAQELPAELTQPSVNTAVPTKLHAPTLQNPSRFMPRQEVSPAQRSALLDMFKSPTAQTATVVRSSATSALPVGDTPSAVELSAVEPIPSVQQKRDRHATEKHPQNGRPSELDPETSRAFKPVSILARPEAVTRETTTSTSRTTQVTPNQLPQRQTPLGVPRTTQPQSAHDKVFAPQILKRPQAGETIDVTKMFQSPPTHANVLPELTPTTASSALGREQPPQHRQNLLSLFGKVPSAASSTEHGSPVPIPSRTSTIDLVSAVSPLDPSARSRMGSIVSAEALSRRGSASTMSKANENFLLGYLDAVAGGGKR